ncbi:MAG: hypothetical protein MUC92_00190 [Fimbriimonadaceae bacterium]|jgi:hypothetical protein|nr:hypothetical protein [Fimbriimonadaceae bacterium]
MSKRAEFFELILANFGPEFLRDLLVKLSEIRDCEEHFFRALLTQAEFPLSLDWTLAQARKASAQKEGLILLADAGKTGLATTWHRSQAERLAAVVAVWGITHQMESGQQQDLHPDSMPFTFIG